MEIGVAGSLTTMPVMLQPHLNATQWSDIAYILNSADKGATQTSCLAELACCFMCGFPCIFCCHQPIKDQALNSALPRECKRINTLYFQGRPVFSSRQGGRIVVYENNICIQSTEVHATGTVLTGVVVNATPVQSAPVTHDANPLPQPSAPPSYGYAGSQVTAPPTYGSGDTIGYPNHAPVEYSKQIN